MWTPAPRHPARSLPQPFSVFPPNPSTCRSSVYQGPCSHHTCLGSRKGNSSQRTEKPPSKDNAWCGHQEIHRISQLRCLDLVQEHNREQSRHYLHQKPVTLCSSPEKCRIAKAQGKALKTMAMVEDLREGMNKCLNEVWKYKYLNEILEKYSSQESRIWQRNEITTKKTQTEIKLEMKNLGCQAKASQASPTEYKTWERKSQVLKTR